MARRLGDPDLSARILNNLGNLLAAQKKYEEALQAYQESASTSLRERGSTAALALVNSATVSFSLGHYGEAKSRIDKALLLLRGLEDSFYKAHALINAGLLCQRPAGPLSRPETDPLTVLASDAFDRGDPSQPDDRGPADSLLCLRLSRQPL